MAESEVGEKRGGILLIDDDPVALLALREILAGFTNAPVCEAADGVRGVEVAIEQSPDIIFLDYRMPRRDGLKVLQDLRSDPQFEGVPIVMVSAQINPEDVKSAHALGAVGCLAKPLSFQQIENSVGSTLRGLSGDDAGRTTRKATPITHLPEWISKPARLTLS